MRVLRKEFERLREELHDNSFVTQRGMWYLVEQRIGDPGTGGTKESEHVVRECKAVAIWAQGALA